MPVFAVQVYLQGFVKSAGCLELELSGGAQNLLDLFLPHKLIRAALDEHIMSQIWVDSAKFGVSNAGVRAGIEVSLAQLLLVKQVL